MPPHVVIAGGGIGALESLLALRALAGDDVAITVITPGEHLTYRAESVVEPFGGPAPARLRWEAIAADAGARLRADVVAEVRWRRRSAICGSGADERYDALVLALGARPGPSLPGTLPFSGPRDTELLRTALGRLARGPATRVAFVAPAGVGWTLPLYELALQTAAHSAAERLGWQVAVFTTERAPLALFGAEAAAEVAQRLAAAGVELHAATTVTEVAGGRILHTGGGTVPVALAISLPPAVGPRLPGLEHDDDGFVAVGREGRVRGVDRVWAVGDMTARRVKQGGLAAQQADDAAADVAALLRGAAPHVAPRRRPSLRGKLVTGAEPLFLERRPGAPADSQASERFLWWPAQKVAGRYAGPYLEARANPSVAHRG
jgi:sulfide:quinone oxidoreductase